MTVVSSEKELERSLIHDLNNNSIFIQAASDCFMSKNGDKTRNNTAQGKKETYPGLQVRWQKAELRMNEGGQS